MDTKKISALLLAVECGSLTSAANELGYTQSGMTHMMNSLEDELGVSLLIRAKSGVHLSPTGQALLPEMRTLIAASDALVNSAERLKERNVSTLNLGAFASVSRQWIPAIVAEFKKISPETDVTITMGDMEGLYNGVRGEHLDCAIVSYQESLSQGISWVPLRNDELLAVLPENPVIPSGRFDVSGFSGTEFLMPAAGFDMDVMPIFNANRHITPNIKYTNLDDGAIVSMVEHGLGVSVLSDLIMRDMVNDVQVLPLVPPAYRNLGIIVNSRHQGDKNIRRFISSATATIGEMYKEK